MSVQMPLPVQRRVDYFEAVAANAFDVARAHPEQPAQAALLLELANALEESIRLIKLANWQARLNQETIREMVR